MTGSARADGFIPHGSELTRGSAHAACTAADPPFLVQAAPPRRVECSRAARLRRNELPSGWKAATTRVRVTTRRYSFQIVRESGAAYPKGAAVTSPRKAVAIARHVIGAEISECLIAIFLNARNKVTGYTEIARGSLNAVNLEPRDVLVPALHVGCRGLVIAHNHPSQDPRPSRADREVTRALREVCGMVGVPLLDHLIVTESAYYSFCEAQRWEE